MMVIGITGPTGAGKTTALKTLTRLDFQVIDCDALYYELLSQDKELRCQLRDAFGEIFLPDGKLNRRSLAAKVFRDERELKKLNRIVYPAIMKAVDDEIQGCQKKGVAIDAINLVESGLGELCDMTIALVADPAIRLKRIMARDGIDESAATSRIKAQKPDSYYKKHCTFVLDNRAASKAEFEDLVFEFFEDLISDM